MRASLTVLYDWQTLHSSITPQELRDLFISLSVDCYGRTADTGEMVYILDGTVQDAYTFLTGILNVVPQTYIVHMGIGR